MVRLHYTPGSKLGLMLDISARSPETNFAFDCPAFLVGSWKLQIQAHQATSQQADLKNMSRQHMNCSARWPHNKSC